MKAAHRGEVGGQTFGVSLLQLLDEDLDVGCDRFLRGLLFVGRCDDDWGGALIVVLGCVLAAVVWGFEWTG